MFIKKIPLLLSLFLVGVQATNAKVPEEKTTIRLSDLVGGKKSKEINQEAIKTLKKMETKRKKRLTIKVIIQGLIVGLMSTYIVWRNRDHFIEKFQ